MNKDQFDKLKEVMWNTKLTHNERVKKIRQIKDQKSSGFMTLI